MIDLHSHILPEVDDGAANTAEALTLLRLAAADGVAVQVLTPHIHPHRYGNTPSGLRAAFATFRASVAEAQIPIRLLLAAEVRIGPKLLQQVAADDMPWLGAWQGERVFLLEMPYSKIPVGSIKVIERLRAQGIRPMIAHPERINEVQARPDKLAPFIEAGCLLQVTAASLTGEFGTAARKVAQALLERGAVTALATDCHSIVFRPPALRAGVDAAAALVGRPAAEALVTTNPRQLIGRLDEGRDAPG